MKIVISALIIAAIYLLGSLPFVAAFILAAVIHELGHIIAAKLVGSRILSFGSSIFGMKLRYQGSRYGCIGECAVSLSGSLLGILSAFLISKTPLIRYDFAVTFAALSVTLSIFNLLPIRGLDGGAAVSVILEKYTFPERAEEIMTALSVAVSVIIWIISLRIQLRVGINYSLLVLSVYLLFSSIKGT